MPKKREAASITFERPPFAAEVFTKEYAQKFDELTGWARHLTKRLIEHGDLERAAKEAGVSTYVKQNVDIESANKMTMQQALTKGGITTEFLVDHLKECIMGEGKRLDKHGNPVYFVDLNLKLKAIDMICRLRGDYFAERKTEGVDKGVVELFENTDPKGTE